MNASSINHRLFHGLLFLLALALSLSGCRSDSLGEFGAEVSVEKSEVKPGESIKVYAELKHPPKGLHYRWAADRGQLEPQNDSLETLYTAPRDVSREQDITVKITVEFFQGDRLIDRKPVSVTIKKDEIANPPTGPDSTIPAPSLPLKEGEGARPSIEITHIPPYHPGGPVEMFRIEGKVSGVPPEGYRVLLYAETDFWYIQPFNTGDLRFTEIESDGSFSTQTHGGMRYAALLVKDSLTDPPIKTDRLPRKGNDVLAALIIDGKK